MFTSPSLLGSSVQTKVLNQIKFINEAGADCIGAFFSTEITSYTQLNQKVELIPVEKCNWNYFKSIGRSIKIMQAVLNYVNDKYDKIDYIYFRFPGASNLLKKFISLYGNKTIFEHLCIEELELKLNAQENQFGIKPSKLLSWLEFTALPLWREKFYGKFVRRYAKMGICNSEDIAIFQTKKGGGKYKCIIGGDAVDVSSIPLSKRFQFKDELRLIFLKGANTNAYYNGLDRVFEGLKKYEGEIKIKIFVLGLNTEYEIKLSQEFGIYNTKVFFPGFIKGVELNDFFSSIHLAVSQFGIYRKGLKSNSTIKSREYIARGIPMIVGHSDPDFNEEAIDFLLQFPNDSSPIDMEQVIDFAKKTLSNPELPQKMRKYALEHLDYEVKMKKLVQILLKLKNE